MTHLCSDRVTHTKNRPCPWARSEQAISSTPKACKVFGSAGPSRQLPVCTGPAREQYTTQLSVVVGHFWRAKYGHFSRVPKASQPAGPQTERLTQFAPVLLIQLYFVFLRSGLDAFPGGVAFRVGHPLHLLEAGDCVAHVSRVMDGFFAFLGESEVFIGDMIAASLSDLGHVLS